MTSRRTFPILLGYKYIFRVCERTLVCVHMQESNILYILIHLPRTVSIYLWPIVCTQHKHRHMEHVRTHVDPGSLLLYKCGWNSFCMRSYEDGFAHARTIVHTHTHDGIGNFVACVCIYIMYTFCTRSNINKSYCIYFQLPNYLSSFAWQHCGGGLW